MARNFEIDESDQHAITYIESAEVFLSTVGRVTIQAKKMRYPVIRYNKTYHISKCSAGTVVYGTAGINWQK